MRKSTLIFPRELGRIWLAQKKLKVGAGFLNGWGGKVEEEDPSVEEAALREFSIEAKVSEADMEGAVLKKRAIIDFFSGGEHTFECHIFLLHRKREGDTWVGKLHISEEMGEPRYFDLWGLPVEQMMASDREWLPIVVNKLTNGQILLGKCYYNCENTALEMPSEFEITTETNLSQV